MSKYNSNTFTLQSNTFNELYEAFVLAYNEKYNTNYNINSFQATDNGRMVYIIVQFLMNSENDVANLSERFKTWLNDNNILLSTPTGTSQYIIDTFKKEGYDIGLKPILNNNEAGKWYIVVDLGKDVIPTAQQINTIVSIIAKVYILGMSTIGDYSGTYTYSDNNVNTFRFSVADYQPLKLRYTLTYQNNSVTDNISIANLQEIVFNNFNSLYNVGGLVTPNKYLSLCDDSNILKVVAEYSIDDGVTWVDGILNDDYKIKRTLKLDDIIISIVGV